MTHHSRFLLTLLLLVLAACSGAATPTPTPTPTPQAWLDRAVQAWNATESFHFELVLDNRTVTLDAAGTLSFNEASGDVVAPDRVRAETLIKTVIGNVEVAFIAIGAQQWLTNPLNGKWEEAPPALQTDVASLFSAETGIGALLADMQTLSREADETLNDVSSVHLRGTLPASVLATFAPELATSTDPLQVDLWASASDGRPQQIILTEPGAEAEAARWTFRFSNFNAAPAIEPPL